MATQVSQIGIQLKLDSLDVNVSGLSNQMKDVVRQINSLAPSISLNIDQGTIRAFQDLRNMAKQIATDVADSVDQMDRAEERMLRTLRDKKGKSLSGGRKEEYRMAVRLEGISNDTIKKVIMPMGQAMAYAVEQGVISGFQQVGKGGAAQPIQNAGAQVGQVMGQAAGKTAMDSIMEELAFRSKGTKYKIPEILDYGKRTPGRGALANRADIASIGSRALFNRSDIETGEESTQEALMQMYEAIRRTMISGYALIQQTTDSLGNDFAGLGKKYGRHISQAFSETEKQVNRQLRQDAQALTKGLVDQYASLIAQAEQLGNNRIALEPLFSNSNMSGSLSEFFNEYLRMLEITRRPREEFIKDQRLIGRLVEEANAISVASGGQADKTEADVRPVLEAMYDQAKDYARNIPRDFKQIFAQSFAKEFRQAAETDKDIITVFDDMGLTVQDFANRATDADGKVNAAISNIKNDIIGMVEASERLQRISNKREDLFKLFGDLESGSKSVKVSIERMFSSYQDKMTKALAPRGQGQSILPFLPEEMQILADMSDQASRQIVGHIRKIDEALAKLGDMRAIGKTDMTTFISTMSMELDKALSSSFPTPSMTSAIKNALSQIAIDVSAAGGEFTDTQVQQIGKFLDDIMVSISGLNPEVSAHVQLLKSEFEQLRQNNSAMRLSAESYEAEREEMQKNLVQTKNMQREVRNHANAMMEQDKMEVQAIKRQQRLGYTVEALRYRFAELTGAIQDQRNSGNFQFSDVLLKRVEAFRKDMQQAIKEADAGLAALDVGEQSVIARLRERYATGTGEFDGLAQPEADAYLKRREAEYKAYYQEIRAEQEATRNSLVKMMDAEAARPTMRLIKQKKKSLEMFKQLYAAGIKEYEAELREQAASNTGAFGLQGQFGPLMTDAQKLNAIQMLLVKRQIEFNRVVNDGNAEIAALGSTLKDNFGVSTESFLNAGALRNSLKELSTLINEFEGRAEKVSALLLGGQSAVFADGNQKKSLLDSSDLHNYIALYDDLKKEEEAHRRAIRESAREIDRKYSQGLIEASDYKEMLDKINQAEARLDQAVNPNVIPGGQTGSNFRGLTSGSDTRGLMLMAKEIESMKDTIPQITDRLVMLSERMGEASKKAGSLTEAGYDARQEILSGASEYKNISQQVQRYIDTLENLERRGIELSASDSQRLQTLRQIKSAADENLKSIRMTDSGLRALNATYEMASSSTGLYSAEVAQAVAQNFKFFSAISMVSSAMFALRSAFTEIIEEGRTLSRVYTVMRSGSMSFSEVQSTVTNRVREASVVFGESIQTTSEVVKQLGSAGFSTEEALAALVPTMQLVVATSANVEATTRTVAGIYRVYAKEMRALGSDSKAFAKINDILVSTYRNHQVELEELNQGLKFVATTGASAGFSFAETTAYLAVLNDNMIKSGAAGRGLQVVFSQMSAKIPQIAQNFGVTLKKNKPLQEQFLYFLQELNARYTSGAISAGDLRKQFSIFGLRGARVATTLVQNFTEVKKTLKELGQESDGTAARISAIVTGSLAKEFDQAKQSLLDIARGLIDPLKEVIVMVSNIAKAMREAFADNPIVSHISSIIVMLGILKVAWTAARAAGQLAVTGMVTGFGSLDKQFGLMDKWHSFDGAQTGGGAVTPAVSSDKNDKMAKYGTNVRQATQDTKNLSKATDGLRSGLLGLSGVASGVVIAALTGLFIYAFAEYRQSARKLSQELGKISVDLTGLEENKRKLETFANEIRDIHVQFGSGDTSEVGAQRVVDAYKKVGSELISNAEISKMTTKQIVNDFERVTASAGRAAALAELMNERDIVRKRRELEKGINRSLARSIGTETQDAEFIDQLASSWNKTFDALMDQRRTLSSIDMKARELLGKRGAEVAGYALKTAPLLSLMIDPTAETVFNKYYENIKRAKELEEQLFSLRRNDADTKKILAKEKELNDFRQKYIVDGEKAIKDVEAAVLDAYAKDPKNGKAMADNMIAQLDQVMESSAAKNLGSHIRARIEAELSRKTFDIAVRPVTQIDNQGATTGYFQTMIETLGIAMPEDVFASSLASVVEMRKQFDEIDDTVSSLSQVSKGEAGGFISSTIIEGVSSINLMDVLFGKDSAVNTVEKYASIIQRGIQRIDIGPDDLIDKESMKKGFMEVFTGLDKSMQDILVNRTRDMMVKAGLIMEKDAKAIGADKIIESMFAINWDNETALGFASNLGTLFRVVDKDGRIATAVWDHYGRAQKEALEAAALDPALENVVKVMETAFAAQTTLNSIQRQTLKIAELSQLYRARSANDGSVPKLKKQLIELIEEGRNFDTQIASSQQKINNIFEKMRADDAAPENPALQAKLNLYKSIRDEQVKQADQNTKAQQELQKTLKIDTDRKLTWKERRKAIVQNNNEIRRQNALLAKQLEYGMGAAFESSKRVELLTVETHNLMEMARVSDEIERSFINSGKFMGEALAQMQKVIAAYQEYIALVSEENGARHEMLADIHDFINPLEKMGGLQMRFNGALARGAYWMDRAEKLTEKINYLRDANVVNKEWEITKAQQSRFEIYKKLVPILTKIKGLADERKQLEEKLNNIVDKRREILKDIQKTFEETANKSAASLKALLEAQFDQDKIAASIKLSKALGISYATVFQNQQYAIDKYIEAVKNGSLQTDVFSGSIANVGGQLRGATVEMNRTKELVSELGLLQYDASKKMFNLGIEKGDVQIATKGFDQMRSAIMDATSGDPAERVRRLQELMVEAEKLRSLSVDKIREVRIKLTLLDASGFMKQWEAIKKYLSEDIAVKIKADMGYTPESYDQMAGKRALEATEKKGNIRPEMSQEQAKAVDMNQRVLRMSLQEIYQKLEKIDLNTVGNAAPRKRDIEEMLNILRYLKTAVGDDSLDMILNRGKGLTPAPHSRLKEAPVRKMNGGKIPGFGGGDRVPALLERGEYIVPKDVVSQMGYKFFDDIVHRGMRFNQGTKVSTKGDMKAKAGLLGKFETNMGGQKWIIQIKYDDNAVVSFFKKSGAGKGFKSLPLTLKEMELVRKELSNNPLLKKAVEEMADTAKFITDQRMKGIEVKLKMSDIQSAKALTKEELKKQEELKKSAKVNTRDLKAVIDTGKQFIERFAFAGPFLSELEDAIKDGGREMVAFVQGFLMPEFAQANAEVYRQMLKQMVEIDKQFQSSIGDARTSLRRNQSDFYAYINSIEDAEKQRLQSRLDAERQYRESLKKTGDVFREAFASGGGSIFTTAGGKAQEFTGAVSKGAFGNISDNFAQVVGGVLLSSTFNDSLMALGKDKLDNINAGLKKRGERELDPAAVKAGAGGFAATGFLKLLGNATFAQIGSLFDVLTRGITSLLSLTMKDDFGKQTVMFIEKFTRELPEAVPKFTEKFAENANLIVSSIAENAPAIVDSLVTYMPRALDSFVTTLEENLPKITQAVIGGLPRLIEGVGPLVGRMLGLIIEQIPTMLSGVIEAIPVFLKVLVTKVVPTLILSLIKALANTLISIVNLIPGVNLPKFHDGGFIGRDERLLIAQTGEGILSRKGMKSLGGTQRLNALNSGKPLESIAVTPNRPTSSLTNRPSVVNSNSTTNNNFNVNATFERGESDESVRKKGRILAESIEQEMDKRQRDGRSSIKKDDNRRRRR